MDRITDLKAQQKQITQEFRENEEKEKEAAWGDYGSTYVDYSHTFDISYSTLPKFIESIKKRHTPHGLDLLSGTEMLSSLGISGIAVGLTDTRSQEQKSLDESLRYVVTGDLLHERKKVWADIRKQMELHQIPSFDLITQRGVMGFDAISPDPALHFYHLKKMWSVLSEGGMILTEISSLDSDVLEKNHLCEYWSQVPGIKAIMTRKRGLQLFKYKNAPQTLPINFKATLAELKEWKRTYHFDSYGNWLGEVNN